MNKHIITKIKPILTMIILVLLSMTITACSNSNLSGIQNQLNEKYSETEPTPPPETEEELSAGEDEAKA